MDSLTYLTLRMYSLEEPLDLNELTPIEIDKLQDYMKKKKMKYTLEGKQLVVHKMTSSTIPHLFRYFLLGKKTKEISIRLLYDCWDEKEKHDYLYFRDLLAKHLQMHKADYFTFKDKLVIKSI